MAASDGGAAAHGRVAWFVRERGRGGAVPVPPPVTRPVVFAAVPARSPEPSAGLRDGPYPGSALPLAGGIAPPAEFVVKGNASSMIHHTPLSPSYARTVAEVWFRTAEDALAAGFRAPKRGAGS